MDPTTLITFLFRAPPDVRIVELLGSWDNFEMPYRMHHDRLRGPGFWSGCFKFENIIFDGDEIQWAKPRTGGLKQGGTYWYYYRFNYDSEAYDDRQPRTTGCPLLPGQTVNVIEIPIEIVEIPERCQSAHGYGDIMGSLTRLADQLTLDPKDKFAMLEPPPFSRVHARCHSDEALDGRLENQPLATVQDTVSPVATPVSRSCRSVSLHSRSSVRLPGENSYASSVYSQRSSQSEAISTLSRISEMSIPVRNDRATSGPEEGSTDASPSYPYPGGVGPTPLEFDASGAALFDSSETVSLTGLSHTAADQRNEGEFGEASLYSRSPASVQNVQFYGSRPGTSLTEDSQQYRPRMYSLPTKDVSDLSEESHPASPISPTYVYSPRDPEDCDENPTPEDGIFHLASPTFTATTISTGGHNTPFRLSTQTTCEGATITEGEIPDSLEASRNTSVISGPSIFERTMARLGPPSFLNYSLPRSATESHSSLVKTISSPSTSRRQDLPLPSIFREEAKGSSMVDDIFSELGYLSGNIN